MGRGYEIIRDANGNLVPVTIEELDRLFSENIATVFGLNRSVIREMRLVYLQKGGHLPITPESVREVFR